MKGNVLFWDFDRTLGYHLGNHGGFILEAVKERNPNYIHTSGPFFSELILCEFSQPKTKKTLNIKVSSF